MAPEFCDACNGQRLKPEVLAVTLADHETAARFGKPDKKIPGLSIMDVCGFSIEAADRFFAEHKLTDFQQKIAAEIIREIRARLGFLSNVGLGYLTLNRESGTLSGGEAQRIRLATQIGAGLVGVLYILDEPSIGLHQRDNERLLKTLRHLRDIGNSVIVVEHDEDTIRQADYLLDLGPGAHKEIRGKDLLDKIIVIDQTPIGRTPRSNPATYTGMFNDIRDLFSRLPSARIRGYGASRFSFNVKGGRCERCQGDGVLKIEMHFLPPVYVTCESCNGRRYNRETLEINYKGMNIADVLDMTVDEAVNFFRSVPQLYDACLILAEVGLGYIRLGQSATTLSGGEAQRLKLGAELSRKSTGRTLYILDEPTTGLHFHDVAKLLEVLFKLRAPGNTLVVIEHNLDVIKTADWVIDLGPEGGQAGGRIVAQGTPETVAQCKESYTGQFLARILKPT
jgi:excinuclease UvrABC ATPase subunit